MKRSAAVVGFAVAAVCHATATVSSAAQAYALAGSEAAGFAVPADMSLVRRLPLPGHGLVHERYQQTVGGARVLGGQVTVFRDASGTAVLVLGSRHPGLAPRNVARLSHAEARATAVRRLGRSGEARSELMIDPTSGRYFYRVETRGRQERWVQWVDATSGAVLKTYDDRQSGHGTGVKGDAKDLRGPDGVQGTVDDLTTFHAAAGHGEPGPHWDLVSADGRQRTLDARNGLFFAFTATDADDAWTLVTASRASPGQPALVDAHYYAQVTDAYLRQRHGLDWIGGCGYPAMQSVAHYFSDYVNAFWDGTSVVYGDGDGFVAREFSGALDVVAHENTHGVTECTSGLIYQDESGALNEAFSDMMASAAEHFAAERGLDPAATPDWWIGEDVFLLSPQGFRSMADPAENLDPDHYSERQVGGDDNGGVHINSGIPNHAFYLLVNGGRNAGEAQDHPHAGPDVAGIGLPAAERIFFVAFTGLAENATMCDARAATEAAASSLFGTGSAEVRSTTDAWLAVGLTDVVCGNVPPEAPSGLTATTTSSSRIALAWTDNSASEDGFKVERSDDGAAFVEIAVLGPGATSYTDTGLAAGTGFWYRVRSFVAARHSDYSNVAEATTGPPPAAPTGLTATAVSSGRINLGWVDHATAEAGFEVERSTDGVSFTPIAVLGANAQAYSNTALAPSTTYHYRVRAYDGPNHSDYSNLASATTGAAPAAPTGLTATAVSSSRINLAWTDNATGETGYRVERSADGVSFSLVVTLAANARTYSNLNLPAATSYFYRVAATDGFNPTWSNVASATTAAPPPQPTSLAAAAPSSSRIVLTWTDSASYEQGYRVERSGDGVNFTHLTVVGANVTSYTNLSLPAGATYHYRVRAYDGPNQSDYSNPASASTLPPPAAPSGLTASAVSPSRIELAWNDASGYEQGFRVERSTDGVSFVRIATLGANVTGYAAYSLVAGTEYHFRVEAYDGPNASAFSNVASATTGGGPAAPSGLVAAALSASRVALQWTDNATGETGFKVERSTDGASFTQVATLAANVTAYTNQSLVGGTTYYYRVRAYEGTANNSNYSNVASATTQPYPAPPTDLTATAASATRINLTWTDNASNEIGYRLERSTDGVNFSQLVSLGANATSYSNAPLAPETTYFYRVLAHEGVSNESPHSNVASAATLPPPPAPGDLVAIPVSGSRIDLRWTDNSTYETGYRVERSTDGVSFTQIASLGANAKTYVNNGLTAGTTYYYRVRAVEGTAVFSAYSDVATASTP